MKSLTPWCPEELRERRIGGRRTAAQRTANTKMTRIATIVFQPFGSPVPGLSG